MNTVAVVGAGTMGAGIAQIAAQNGAEVKLIDVSPEQIERAKASLEKILRRLEEKGRIESFDSIYSRICFETELPAAAGAELAIEAVVERLDVKQSIFKELEASLAADAILATNTSSLSVAGIASALEQPERLIGLHFFNPAPLLPLVEVVRSIRSDEASLQRGFELMKAWGKSPVLTGDTPGFIVNRIARPFYGEAFRIVEEGIAEVADIDWAMKTLGGFKMGPFELVDLIGMDINYAVSESVFQSFYCDPRFKPSLLQKRMVEAGLLGRKSGRGFYDYSEGAEKPASKEDKELGQLVFQRIISMLINEACDARLFQVASAEDIETAMTKGVNYPKGLLSWGDELGAEQVLSSLSALHERYGEDRYRPNAFLRDAVAAGKSLLS